MKHRVALVWNLSAVAIALAAPFARATEVPNVTEALAVQAEAPGLGDPGKLVSLAVESASYELLRGSDARRQLVITGKHSSGQLRDWTRKVTFESLPPGIVATTETGFVTPLANGDATVVAHGPDGIQSRILWVLVIT